MDGTDMHRRIAAARRQARRQAEWEQLRRDQRPPEPGSAAECLAAARNPDRRLEPMRRALGRPESIQAALMR
jgi:hypothetical protein